MPVYKASFLHRRLSVDGGVKMSKNTGASAFRRVDVDQFSEEKYEEEAVVDDGVIGPNDAEVHHMLNEYPFRHPASDEMWRLVCYFLFFVVIVNW